MVDVDDVESAVLALLNETFQPAETGGTAAVGDGRRGEGGSALEGFEEIPENGGTLGRVEVCLAGVIRFVGAGNFQSADEGAVWGHGDLRKKHLSARAEE